MNFDHFDFKAQLVVFIFFVLIVSPLSAEIVFESGTLGQTGVPISELLSQNVPGTNVSADVFAGVRFRLDRPVITSQVGGHFVANGGETFFSAIVALDHDNDFPNSDDFSTDDFLGSTLLTFPTPSDEVFGDLSILLEPGWYALAFGSGLFGADGSGVAVRNGVDIGNPSYIVMGPNFGWFDTTISPNHRFFVKGRVIPEPCSANVLFPTIILLVGHLRLGRAGRVGGELS